MVVVYNQVLARSHLLHTVFAKTGDNMARRAIPIQGKKVSRRRVLQAGLAVGAGAILRRSALGASPSPSLPDRRPNIILLVADDQRWDSIGCAGNSVIQTPNIDALAARGTRFRQSFATTAICPSSRATILTGLYTRTHG